MKKKVEKIETEKCVSLLLPKREKYDRCISLPFLTKNRPICPSQFSFFAENGELPFCIYVTALNDDDNNFEQSLRWTAERDKKATLFCLHTFTMIGGGVDETKWASVSEFEYVNYLRNVQYVNSDGSFKF